MDEQTRKDVDYACLTLLGWKPLHWFASPGGGGAAWYASPPGDDAKGHICPQPSRDPALIVPLAEALYDHGFLVRMFQTSVQKWSVSIVGKDGFGHLVAEQSGDSLPVCLALAAARAAGEP